jgi:hypothetical protein
MSIAGKALEVFTMAEVTRTQGRDCKVVVSSVYFPLARKIQGVLTQNTVIARIDLHLRFFL